MERYHRMELMDLVKRLQHHLKMAFGKTGIIVFLSVTIGQLYFFFRAAGLKVDHLIGVVCRQEVDFRRIVKALHLMDESNEDSLLWWEDEPAEYLSIQRDCLSPAYMAMPYKRKKELEVLLDLIKKGKVYQTILIGLENEVPKEYRRNIIPLVVEEWAALNDIGPDIDAWQARVISYGTKNGGRLIDRLNQFCSSVMIHEEYPWLYAALEVVEMICKPSSPDYSKMKTDLADALKIVDDLQDGTGLSEAVVELLYLDAESGRRLAMPNRKDLEAVSRYEIGSVPYCDGQYFYYSDPLFQEICAPLLNNRSLSQINEALAEDQIQAVERGYDRLYYTRKVVLRDGADRVYRPRFHCIYRDAVKRTSEDDLECLYNESGGGINGSSHILR